LVKTKTISTGFRVRPGMTEKQEEMQDIPASEYMSRDNRRLCNYSSPHDLRRRG
jgi:hypothetical protein